MVLPPLPRRRAPAGPGRVAVLAGTALLVAGCAAGRGRAVPPPAMPAPREVGAGMLPVRYDPATGKLFLTIRRLDEDLLYFNSLATGLGTASPLLDRGQVGNSAVVRFLRRGARVFLVRQNASVRAVAGSPALQRSVEESFPASVLASFPVQGDGGAAGVVVDATEFFLSDVFDVVGELRTAHGVTLRVDRDRSFIDPSASRALAMNTEIRAVLSYTTETPPGSIRQVAPEGRSFTMAQHHAFVRLPDSPLPVRPFDPRAGLNPHTFFDFSQGFASDYRQRGVVRWRLEPRDPAAYARGEPVEPVRPIVYYLDPAIPEPYRSAFVEGGMWWNRVFEAAGWRDAFRIEALPSGVDPLDARYPLIYWVHRQQRGPSVGPSYRDPRSGEILSTVVRMDSYRSLVDHDIYMGLLSAAGPGGLQMSAEEFAMARRRQHAAHEIGHTLGLQHNFIASAQGRSSVMDYPYPLVGLDARGELDISQAYRPGPGAHDTLAIRYGYTWFPDSATEAAGLRRIIREGEARGLRFVGDAHVGTAGSYPAATQWVEGDDMLSALERTLAVRRLLIDRFGERAAQPGEPLAVLNRRFAHVYLHHRYALQGAIKYVGGMEFGYALAGEGTVPTRVIPPAEQRRALRLVLSALQPEVLRIPERVSRLIPPVPPGWDADLTLIPTPAGTAFDPLAAAHSLAQEVVGELLHPERAARVVSFHARDPASPSLHEVLTGLVGATWGASAGGAADAALLRVAQRAALDGLLDLAGSAQATAQVRALAEHHLRLLEGRMAATAGGAAEDRAHRATAAGDIARYFAGRDTRASRPRPAPIPLPWP